MWRFPHKNKSQRKDFMLKKLKLLFTLVAILVGVSFFGDAIPLYYQELFYAISIFLKQVLLFAIPFVIFSYIFHSLTSQGEGALAFIGKLVVLVYCSNLIAIMMSYGVSSFSLEHWGINLDISGGSDIPALEPLFNFFIPKIIPNEWALIGGFIAGVIFSLYRHPIGHKASHYCNTIANIFLRKLFIPLLPLFIFGFVVKLKHDEMLEQVITMYGPVFLIVISMQVCYLTFLYLLGAGFSLKKFFYYLRNVATPGVTAFSAMSSVAAMPLSVVAAEQNTKDSNLAKLIIPSTVNIHTIGSAIGMTTLMLITSLVYTGAVPELSVFIKFALFWALAKFAVAAVPGGAVIVAAPLMEQYLGFSGEMIGLITVAYMFFDPFGTTTNVLGNGAFAILFSKLNAFIGGKHKVTEEEVEEALEPEAYLEDEEGHDLPEGAAVCHEESNS